MDIRIKHLNSEELGVIFAEHSRGSSQRSIGGCWVAPRAPLGASLPGVNRTTGLTALRQGGSRMKCAGRAVDGSAN
jgi:hypothetical protein